MNIFHKTLSIVVLTAISLTIAAQDKFIDRVKNESTQHTIYIAPFNKEIQEELTIEPAYSITAHTDFDVTLEQPILVNKHGDDKTGLRIVVGEAASEINLADLQEGNNTLLVNKQGAVTVEPSKKKEAATQGLFDTESDGTFEFEKKYITRIDNRSDRSTIHILPFWERYIVSPSGMPGYTISNSAEGWSQPIDVEKVTIGVDKQNTGILVYVDEEHQLHYNPTEFNTILKKHNKLIIGKDGTIKLIPLEEGGQ